jgi:hypothetical protein
MLDLSKFKQSFVKDTAEEIAAIASINDTRKIGVGTHEVVVSKIHVKDGAKLKFTDKLGGTVGFSLVVENTAKEEQMVYLSIPLAVTFKQAIADKENGFPYKKTAKTLLKIGIDPGSLREALIMTDGKAVDELVGAQMTITNLWPDRKLHLEYDRNTQASILVNSQGERFTEGVLSGTFKLDFNKKENERYNHIIELVTELGFEFAKQMDSNISTHPTTSNEKINELLTVMIKPKAKQTGFVPLTSHTIINKTKPVFPDMKKPVIKAEDVDYVDEV